MQDVRRNLGVRWDHKCEMSGEPFDWCHASHLFARELCKKTKNFDWIGEWLSNAVLLHQSFNHGMTLGFWVDYNGQYCPPDGKDYLPWMIREGVPKMRIEMVEQRPLFAELARNFQKEEWHVHEEEEDSDPGYVGEGLVREVSGRGATP